MAAKKIQQDEKFERQDFDLFAAIEAVDKKDYAWFDKLSEEQQRKFVPYMMLHWVSSIKTSGVLGSYYVLSTDANANKHLFNENVQHHPKLQWLMLCSASPGVGKQYHQWIPHLNAKIGELREAAKQREVLEYFQKVYKNADDSTLKTFAKEFTVLQNHKHRIAKMYPDLKVSDIDVLANFVSEQELDEYEQQSGS